MAYRSASFFRLFLEKTKEKVIRYPGGVRFLLAVNTGAAFWHAASFLPVPTVYPKTEFKGHLERTPVPDPRTEIIFCNNGKIPLIIQSFHFEQNGKKIDLATIKDPLFEYSGGSKPREWKRPIAPNSKAIVLATYRPVDSEVSSGRWAEKIESCLEGVELIVTYRIPFLVWTVPKNITFRGVLYASDKPVSS